MIFDTSLPIDDVLESLKSRLQKTSNAVLVAPPGAGKTTRVPLALLDEPWMLGKKLVMLEPRRLAARAAAERMAQTLGEVVGETIGLRVRFEAKSSPKTRIEVVTEGVFTRMILDDPELVHIGAVLFDEFHERSLDADLGLALALDAQNLREDLRILVMSATLDGARVAQLLKSDVIESRGRSYPVETRYQSRDLSQRLEDQMADIIAKTMRNEQGSCLVFLPGQGEIRRLETFLKQRIDPCVHIAPLYGAMERAAQDRAVQPSPSGQRKIVLATSIAETSLTIEGVRIVIDSGLARVPVYDPGAGLTRLETQRASQAAVDQRRGRAGRLEAGLCIRLWEEAATQSLRPFTRPEILSSDLSTFVLNCALWGVRDPVQLRLLDPPPKPALQEAKALLARLEALDEYGFITPLGCALQNLALPVRLARMVLIAARSGNGQKAAELAALLNERGLGGDAIDLDVRLQHFQSDTSPRARDVRSMVKTWTRLALDFAKDISLPVVTDDTSGALLALAFPERIARSRGKGGAYVMVNGRGAGLEPHDRLAREPWLVVANVSGEAVSGRILSAAFITQEQVEQIVDPESEYVITYDSTNHSLKARQIRRIGAITLNDQPVKVEPSEQTAHIFMTGLVHAGLAHLPWSKTLLQWRDRVMFLQRTGGEWPDLSDESLIKSADSWLMPLLHNKTALSDIKAHELTDALHALLPWDLQRQLEKEAPTHFLTPAGSSIPIEYTENGPVLPVRVQELFGLKSHPSLAGIALALHLLSPAFRPIQITKDLPRFWQGSWADVKAEMRGRYPKHSWPDDPANAIPVVKGRRQNLG